MVVVEFLDQYFEAVYCKSYSTVAPSAAILRVSAGQTIDGQLGRAS